MTGPSSAAARFARFRRFFVKNAPTTGAPSAAVGMAAWRRLPGLLAAALFTAVSWGAAAQTVSVTAVGTGTANEGDPISFEVTLDATPTATRTVEYNTISDATAGDTATSADYTGLTTTTLTFDPTATNYSNTQTVMVTMLTDDVVERNETFRFELGNPSTGLTLSATADEATGTIINTTAATVSVSQSASSTMLSRLTWRLVTKAPR